MFNWMNWNEPTYNGDYPVWARAIGWMMILSSLIWIPVIWIFEFIRSPGNLAEVRLYQKSITYMKCAIRVVHGI